mmetsp:Transcript_7739/g.16566  ORF Transcript_7739/g.16566 Transcript_7739/m.16566 type:complete len:134 (+) Transcript_7739:288-689(+)|eukprot:CAMPEP_0171331502 /NCGR_PEP_ID=MMETSP0878-20121228/2742_1 /TAXON_ID=67004 /ORGANISM="Thalassiosira weissflogii, Strain CCMP1336" /LENGTH=133 /DNA_ID=CAMNT_0011832047 /DNA_START=200 /DNA_END=601 /DNA_ORIENTATION=-
MTNEGTPSPLFQNPSETFDFRDKLVQLFERFDRDKDNYLNYPELKSLQYQTSGADMTIEQYKHVCIMLDCHPDRGVSVEALRLTYKAEGTDLDGDYEKVFGKDTEKKVLKKEAKKEVQDEVLEVGEDGVDISS